MDEELKEWCKGIEERIASLESCSKYAQQVFEDNKLGITGLSQDVIEIDLLLPEDDIDGLHFSDQKVHAIFEMKEDGWYYSRDILFLSARHTENRNKRDFLAEYLIKAPSGYRNGVSITGQISSFMQKKLCRPLVSFDITISLPKENQGIKKYNGVDCPYWLEDTLSDTGFCDVGYCGKDGYSHASYVGGVAPAFRVAQYGGAEVLNSLREKA
ncbi:MAG: hypothetical protein LBT13_01640 [Treponema sp.]|jgi:hypothetical protein|nr:hypothetical protein [Treponema sp.]